VAGLSPPGTSFTIVPAFVDANILVYAEDRDAGSKHTIARDLVANLWRSGEGVLSVQVLQEFFVTVTRKLPRPLSPDQALTIVEQYLTWRVVENTGDLLLAGIRLASVLKVSFWDALVLQAARVERCDRLWTEDLNHGQRIGDLTIVNPFLPEPPSAAGGAERAGRKGRKAS
jgi:predicted nucleic acid-binding protein